MGAREGYDGNAQSGVVLRKRMPYHPLYICNAIQLGESRLIYFDRETLCLVRKKTLRVAKDEKVVWIVSSPSV